MLAGVVEGNFHSKMSTPEEYLSIKALGDRLELESKTIRNKMANGTFIKGVHYFSPSGMGPRFKWSAVVAWMEAGEQVKAKANGNGIPMAKGYYLGPNN